MDLYARTSDAGWNDPFFPAMAHRRLGNVEEARRWYDRGLDWVNRKAPAGQFLIRSRREAAGLLGVKDPGVKDHQAPATTSRPTTIAEN